MTNNVRHPPSPTLLWYGASFFSKALSDLGWNTTIKRRYQPAAVTWRELFADLPTPPDVLVVADYSGPPPLLDPHTCPSLTVFYSVDSHIHSWHPLYAQAFDLCLVSLRDHLPRFSGSYLDSGRVLWSPPFVQDTLHPAPKEQIWDALFVGKVDADLTPRRHSALQALKQELPNLEVHRGSFPELFPQAKVVLNFCDLDDLNFRVFEALACGTALLTPRIGHGQDDLFHHGENLWLYDQSADGGDVTDLLHQLRRLLADDALRTRLARKGQATVYADHRASHRAAAFTKWLGAHDWSTLIARRQRIATDVHRDILRPLFLHLSESLPEGHDLRARYYQASARHLLNIPESPDT
ncbi:glycosyltransferase family protein [Desulfonatronum thiodismutans]|uniref:glycosyltransferase family protein n=1 Tax=Desulfonatronum thiodismutans TaxID=159290 RepID=UPI00069250D4|nr:glycosyltransferase [Desulfonatronum thiodismutans]